MSGEEKSKHALIKNVQKLDKKKVFQLQVKSDIKT